MLKHEPWRKAPAATREEYVERLAISLGRAKEILLKSQERNKSSFDRRFRHTRKLNADEKLNLKIEEGDIKRGKLLHGVAGAF